MPSLLPAIDILNQGMYNPPDEDNICLICHDTLIPEEEPSVNNPPYTLECKHKYHANCIITWFRSGHNNCPYCGDTGSNGPKQPKKSGAIRRSLYRPFQQKIATDVKYLRLRQYSRRKDAPHQLVRMVDKLKTLENERDDNDKALNEFKDKPANGATWKELNAEGGKLRQRRWAINRKIARQQIEISEYPIIPLIIPKIVTTS